MRLDEIHRKLTEREGYWLWAAWLLQPAAFVYSVAAGFHRFLYEKGLLPVRSFNTVVVSIGNIEVGGVGKTPVTIRIARSLSDMGIKTSVVCKNMSSGSVPPIAVRQGNASGGPFLSDEAVLLGKVLGSSCSVYTAGDKTAAVERAVREMKPEVVIVDDGFQHHKLKRDIDIVVLNADHPFGQGGVLPAGTLRESSRSLSKADYLWINGVTSETQLSLARRLVSGRNWKAPFIPSSVVPGKPLMYDGATDRIGKVVAFCGIGKPQGFKRTLEKTGFEVVKFHIYPDHRRYTETDKKHLMESLKKSSADYLITTEKDAARLGTTAVKSMELRVLPIRLSVLDKSAEEELLGSILELVGGNRD
ncbi:MAG: tetraacyldisaccharide 4'-kinase [Candidatus Fermentibacteraceae bacterium]|nr:tetraacyldisaccharide 4'-kinase [Candidatus Fermentibacteraceae bacterium]